MICFKQAKTDDSERIARAGSGRQVDRRGLDRRFLFAVDKFVAAIRFALDGKSRWQDLDELVR